MSESTKTMLVGAVLFVFTCIAVSIILAVLFFPIGEPAKLPAAPPPGPAAGSAWYQVYFTSPKYPDKSADHRGGIDENLATFLRTAKTSIDMAIYQLDSVLVTQALLDAQRRGVRVRVVTDIDTLEDKNDSASFLQLDEAGIKVIGGNPNGIMHNKFVVVDGAAVWTGSWNFTENDTYRYNNNAILIQSPELAKNYTATFEKMFDDNRFGASRKPGGTSPKLSIGGIPVENYFAPEDKVSSKIAARLLTAKSSIDFMAYSFTDDTLGQAIMERARAGVRVRGVFEKTGSETQYSEYGKMRKSGLDVWQDGNPYLMHHKVFIIDEKLVIFGSYNFSDNADTDNDENLLIVDDAGLAQAFEGEFGRVYQQAKDPPRK